MPNILALEPHGLLHPPLFTFLREMIPEDDNNFILPAVHIFEVTRLLHHNWPTDLIILGHREDDQLNDMNSGTLTYQAVRKYALYRQTPIIGASFTPDTFASATDDPYFHFLAYEYAPHLASPAWNLPALREKMTTLLAPA